MKRWHRLRPESTRDVHTWNGMFLDRKRANEEIRRLTAWYVREMASRTYVLDRPGDQHRRVRSKRRE